jgi:hypothetical protein
MYDSEENEYCALSNQNIKSRQFQEEEIPLQILTRPLTNSS